MTTHAHFSEKTGSAYIIPSDFPDPDVIRVDDTYYLVSTTMHMTPGAVILRSHNLLDWEFCSYVFDELDGTDGQKLADDWGIYGRGMWAACIRHHADTFWVSFVANDTHKSYLYTADKITGPWKRQPMEGFYHDMSVLFDDDGRAWIAHGNREIYLTEMKADLSGPVPDGFNDVIVREPDGHEGLGHEGSHLYKIGGTYYLFTIDWPRGKPRTENCFTADSITGPWKGGPVLSSEFGGWHSGVAQGGIVSTPDGRWYAILFQDHGALGRIPVLVSVRFENGLPVFGEAAPFEKAWEPGRSPSPLVTVPDLRPGYTYAPLYGDAFSAGGRLAPYWQWNHIHDARLVSLTESTFSLTTDKLVKNPVQAANTLTQRTWGLACSASVTLSAAALNNGDVAGLMALEGEYAFIGIMKQYGKYKLVTARHQIPYESWTMGVHDDELPTFITQKPLAGGEVELRLEFSMHEGEEHVTMLFREQGEWRQLGKSAPLRFTLDQFVGVRTALFCYATEKTGGTAHFKSFKMEISNIIISDIV
ncbi:MAG: family 43 glycosylhydrolase [Treponema sp.]|nr:family 43 glycosylhydrolase [Candidatus Treponema caballi]